MRQQEKDKARWAAQDKVIEHEPKEPLDLSGPIPATVLGGDGEPPAA
jgi:hypothetical protein